LQRRVRLRRADGTPLMALTLLKLGGELLEEPGRLAEIAAAIAGGSGPLVVVHGGGREIDAALKRAGIAKRQVEGLRVTGASPLDLGGAGRERGVYSTAVCA